ncbi:MAG: TetR/AcrR family transcriptional regulator [Chloroflexota bacterium]
MVQEVAIRTYSKDQQLVRERRKQIMKGALRVFITNGYHRTSTRQIADACGMSVGSLYHYVGSKEDILYLLIEDTLSTTLQAMSGAVRISDPMKALVYAIDRWIRVMDETQEATLFAYQELRNLKAAGRSGLLDIDRRVAEVFESIIAAGVKKGQFQVADPRLVAHTITVIGHMWAFRRWFFRQYYTVDQFIEKETRLILGGVVSRHGGNGGGNGPGVLRPRREAL